MKERTFETGGEVLQAGSTVMVFDGNTWKVRRVVSVGTQRIHIDGYGSNPVPYSKETRKSQSGAYPSYFKTHTEMAETLRRANLKSLLRDLGVEARVAGYGQDGLDSYPNAALEEVIAVLEKYKTANEG